MSMTQAELVVVMIAPDDGHYVGGVWFRSGIIVAFDVVVPHPAKPNGQFLGRRGATILAGVDKFVPLSEMSEWERTYCKAYKLDGAKARGRFLANYFLPAFL